MLLPKDPNGCPTLQLAPMEGVGDRCFRRAIASVGGFDEAVRDFLRVPRFAHVKSLAKEYEPDEIAPFPLAAQIMGSEAELMADMARELEALGAKRIDINCGCPSNTVTGRGAGSSLLREPSFLHEVAKAVVGAVSIPVTLKMRSGYEDTSLFYENLRAAEESGIVYLTLHPRTKVDGYGPPARWDLIAAAKAYLKIPLVGNGDILTVEHALKMLSETGCDALMIGRGSLIDPFIFHRIRAHFAKQARPEGSLVAYVLRYLAEIPASTPERIVVNKLKQLLGFLFKANAALLSQRQGFLTLQAAHPQALLDYALPLIERSST